ncbi:MAG: hypothetical protein GVY06_08620 [Alphaproteobacteria bacterium]|jgi:glucose/arabinose dehydrogenase|nr:hypothetical protein [Alphaproteobacteria bacterium]
MSGRIFLESDTYSFSERDGVATVAIIRDGDLSGAVTVAFETVPGTAGDDDLVPVSGTVTIPAGETRAVIEIPVLDDAVGEATESFSVSLSNVSSGALQFPRTATVSLLDDENPVEDPVNPPLLSDFDVASQTVFDGLAQPIAFEFLPGASEQMIVAEKGGEITLRNIASGETISTLLDLTGEVNNRQDRGLLDVALHPDFEETPYLYAFYTVDPPGTDGQNGNAGPDGGGNRFSWLVRWELDASDGYQSVVAGSKTLLLGGAGQTLADIAGGGAVDSTSNISIRSSERDPDTGELIDDYLKVDSRSHAGGALEFGPDGALYVSTGDGTSFGTTDPRSVDVQNIDSLSGKILRIDPLTGQGLADNPFFTGDAGENASKVYQLGLRNPFSMSFDSEGRLLITDTGWNNWEEINSGGAGANFGWPFYEGGDGGELLQTSGYRNLPEAADFYADVAAGDIEIAPAFRAFAHRASEPGFQVQAITGADDLITSQRYPDAVQDHYIFTDVSQGEVFAVNANDRRDVKFLFRSEGNLAPVHFKQGPDGAVYFADLVTGKISRLDIFEAGEGTLSAEYFNISPSTSTLDQIDFSAAPDFTETVTQISQSGTGPFYPGGPSDDFAVRYTGTFTADSAGDYTFYLGSDDGSRLFINGAEIIDNDGLQSFNTETGSVSLGAGEHQIEVRYFERAGANSVDLDWAGPGFAREQMRFTAPADGPVVGTSGNDRLSATPGDDVMLGQGGQDVFEASLGDDVIFGDAGVYDQVDYDGGRDDYLFTRNPDGTVTVEGALTGTDTLSEIDGVWFNNAGEWASIDTLVVEDASGPIVGTPGNDSLVGTPGDDTMIGNGGADVFDGSPGNDTITGDASAYDQVDYAGGRDDYLFVRNDDGTVTVTGALTGTDTLTEIDGVWFKGAREWASIQSLIDEDAGGQILGTPGNDDLLGTPGEDVMIGNGGSDTFDGSPGDDEIIGDAGAYDQIDYAGAPEDYVFTRNDDGTVTATGALTGTDTLTEIDGVWFKGSFQWRSLDSLIEDAVPAVEAFTFAQLDTDEPAVDVEPGFRLKAPLPADQPITPVRQAEPGEPEFDDFSAEWLEPDILLS